MKKRVYLPEIMDLGSDAYTKEEYKECLYLLGIIGKYLGYNKSIINELKKIKNPIDSILDVGCGGGLLTFEMAKKFPEIKVYGIDISKDAIDFAENKKLKNLNFELCSHTNFNESEKKYDVIVTSLVCHHLNDEELINFLRGAIKSAKKAIIINDLHRHWLSYLGCSIFFPIFTKNRLIRADSLLSIKKSFTYKDWFSYLINAGLAKENFKISWHWPFYWIVRINLV